VIVAGAQRGRISGGRAARVRGTGRARLLARQRAERAQVVAGVRRQVERVRLRETAADGRPTRRALGQPGQVRCRRRRRRVRSRPLVPDRSTYTYFYICNSHRLWITGQPRLD